MIKKKFIDLVEGQSAYQFPYIALMTLLCILFIFLYAYYMKQLDESSLSKVARIAEQVKEDFSSDATVAKMMKIEASERGVKISFPNALLFEKGTADLKEEVKPTLEVFAESIKSFSSDYTIAVEGNTDNSQVWYGGNYSSNREISLYRALSLVELFVRVGNASDRFSALGNDQYNPVFPNDTPEHCAANRRIELIIRKKSDEVRSFTKFEKSLVQ